MQKQLQGKASIKGIVTFILCLLLTALFLAVGGIHHIIGGPKDLAAIPIDEMDGKYVTFSVDAVLDWYMYTEGLTEDTPEGMGDLVSVSYVALTPDGEHLMGLMIQEKDLDAFFDAYDVYDAQFYAADFDEANALPAPVIKGTVRAMTDEERGFFNELLDAWELPYEYARYSVLQMNYIGNASPRTAFLFCGLGVVFLVAGIVSLVRAQSGSGLKAAKAFAVEQQVGDDTVEEWFAEAEVFGKLRLGPRIIVLQKPPSAQFFAPQDVVWAYQHTLRTNGVPSYSLMLGTRTDKKSTGIGMKKKDLDAALAYIYANYPDIAMGYAPELQQAFANDRDSMRALAAEQRKDHSEAPPAPEL